MIEPDTVPLLFDEAEKLETTGSESDAGILTVPFGAGDVCVPVLLVTSAL